MKIAICQFDIQYENRVENIRRAELFIKDAAAKTARLILFPEMSFTGFSMNTELTGEESMPDDLVELAVKYGIAIGFGWVKGKTNAENHYTVVSGEGKVLGDYAKIHPFSYSGEDLHFQAGNETVTFAYEGFCFGMSICYDMRFPELYQKLSKEAQVLLVPANWPAARKMHWNTLLAARAIENQSYVIGVNCVGTQEKISYSGNSAIINPNGEKVLDAGEQESLKFYDLENDVAAYRDTFPTKKDRKDDLYRTFYEK